MSRETQTIESTDGIKLDARIFRPPTQEENPIPNPNPEPESEEEGSLAIVLVHPYSVLGGCQGLTKGLALGLARRGFHAVTFDMRGVGKSSGRSSLTGSSEVRDVVSVCKWVAQNFSVRRILLVGSSAGAPIAGSAVDQLDEVVGYGRVETHLIEGVSHFQMEGPDYDAQMVDLIVRFIRSLSNSASPVALDQLADE